MKVVVATVDMIYLAEDSPLLNTTRQSLPCSLFNPSNRGVAGHPNCEWLAYLMDRVLVCPMLHLV
jgi:hypothetical protein